MASRISENRFGVDLLMPLQNYQLNMRAVKYSLLFIILTFTTMFFIETILGLRFHPVHYLFCGCSIILFYFILLSYSEKIGFSFSYLLAATATVFTATIYVYSIVKNSKAAVSLFSQLSMLYGFLYVLLNLEGFALIFGASGLWIILIALMYVTRKIDWFSLGMTKTVNGN